MKVPVPVAGNPRFATPVAAGAAARAAPRVAIGRAGSAAQVAVLAREPERRVWTTEAVTAVRRVRGRAADEVFVLCRPCGGSAAAARQAEVLYAAMLGALAAEGVGPEAVVSETVFFRRIAEGRVAARAARRRLLGRAAYRPATTWIGQPPLSDEAHLEIAARAVAPGAAATLSAADVRFTVACPCEACAAGMHARVVRLGDETHLYAGNVLGAGRDAGEEARDMFRVAEGLLAAAGMSFGDVVRTWVHLRDINRDYEVLNQARSEFFRRCGIVRRPASTGVQGVPGSDAHGFSLGLYAVRSRRPLDIAAMSTPLLNEAWTYGAEFSRGLRLVDGNRVALYVSGTASVDEAGRTVHEGRLEAQVDRMLHNIASLLERQGATFENLVSGVVYLKDRAHAPVLGAMLRARGFDGFPCALVEAPLCRAELLCEAEAVAMLPLAATGG